MIRIPVVQTIMLSPSHLPSFLLTIGYVRTDERINSQEFRSRWIRRLPNLKYPVIGIHRHDRDHNFHHHHYHHHHCHHCHYHNHSFDYTILSFNHAMIWLYGWYRLNSIELSCIYTYLYTPIYIHLSINTLTIGSLWLVFKWDEFTFRSLKRYPPLPQIIEGE